MEAVRGPKKKKGETESKIESTDIVNIFKERADPAIRDIREYPLYVQELSFGGHTVHEFVKGIEHNLPSYVPLPARRCPREPTSTATSRPSSDSAPKASAPGSTSTATPISSLSPHADV
jgi:hypothetical protein